MLGIKIVILNTSAHYLHRHFLGSAVTWIHELVVVDGEGARLLQQAGLFHHPLRAPRIAGAKEQVFTPAIGSTVRCELYLSNLVLH